MRLKSVLHNPAASRALVRLVWITGCVVGCLSIGPASAQEPDKAAPAAVIFEPDVVYGRAGDQDLHMDIARPGAAVGDGPFPAVVCIHGGAWRAGDKKHYRGLIRRLAEHGYVAVTIEYRLVPAHRFPAQIEDAKCAVRYLRAHAKALKIDPEHIGAMGESAGAHLSLLLGLTDADAGLEGSGGYADESSKVQAVVNYSGPVDLTLDYPDRARQAIAELVADSARKKPDPYQQASPVTYLTADDPPILTFHGTADDTIPFEQALLLDEKCAELGVKHQLISLEGAGHIILFRADPMLRTLDQAATFFDRHLKSLRVPRG